MPNNLENQFLDYINCATLKQILKGFCIGNIVSQQLAERIVQVRASLPDHRFRTLEHFAQAVGIANRQLTLILNCFDRNIRSHKTLNDRPVLLLPIRLETRFLEDDLWVRIYLDQIFIDTHEPILTQTEFEAGKNYLEVRQTRDGRDAWRGLAQLFGPERAAWVAKAVVKPEPIETRSDDDNWMIVPKLPTLPSKFVVYVYQGSEQVFHKEGKPIPPELTILGDPLSSGETFFDDRSKWMMNIHQAEKEGMAVCITSDDIRKDMNRIFKEDISPKECFSKISCRIVVVGLREGSPIEGQDLLESLLESHHYADGLGFLEHSTPTNNTQTAPSGYSETSEDRESSYKVEILDPAHWDEPVNEPRTNAQRLGHALGFGKKPEVFRHLCSAGDETDSYAKEMQTALWPTTGDYVLRYLLPSIVSDGNLQKLATHFATYVRGSGPLPGIRVGDQPYGILPVTAVHPKSGGNPHGWQASSFDSRSKGFDARLHSILVGLHKKWLSWAKNPYRVPRVNTTPDPDQELLQILSMEPVSVSCQARPFINKEFVAWLLVAMRDYLFGSSTPYYDIDAEPLNWVLKWQQAWQELQAKEIEHWKSLTAVSPDKFKKSPLLWLLSWWDARDVGLDLVHHISEGGKILSKKEQVHPDEYLQELRTPSVIAPTKTARFEKTLLYNLLTRSLNMASNSSLDREAIRDAICCLSSPTLTDVDRLFRETLDLYTHRLDAWITSLATKRLDAMRKEQPSGIYLGAYGWVEGLQPRPKDKKIQSAGYIHAPSSDQAAAAAVLHNAYLTHKNGNGNNPFRINLNSERTRRAMRIIDGVRQGQPLGAMLGYQFERDLHERHLDEYIDNFRAAFPIEITQETDGSVETIAAHNVVDGLVMARWWQNPDRTDIAHGDPSAREDLKHMLHLGEPSERNGCESLNGDAPALCTEVKHLRNSLDAVSDVLTYEGLYQMVQGNFERGGAAVDAASGKAYLQDIESVVTPVSGKYLGQRVCLLFDPTPDATQKTPRALAEPGIAAWVSRVLGDMNEICCRFQFKSERMNINEATERELASLPGIDDTTAKKIVKYRKENGLFSKVDDLQKIQIQDLDQAAIDEFRQWVMTGTESLETERYYERINVNTATKDELIILPGIDDDKANAIIENQLYKQIDDLSDVIGLDANIVDTIRPWITTGIYSLSLQDLDIGAIDVLYLATTPSRGIAEQTDIEAEAGDIANYFAAEETEIEQRIVHWVRKEFGLKYDDRIDLDLSRSNGFKYGFDEALELCRQILKNLGEGKFLQAKHLCLPAEADDVGFIPNDIAKLDLRLSSVLQQVCDLIIDLGGDPIVDLAGNRLARCSRVRASSTATTDTLLKASLYGVSGAIPSGLDDPNLEVRQQNVLKEVNKRVNACLKLRQEALSGKTQERPDQQIRLLIDAMQALFGKSFVVLPTFTPHFTYNVQTGDTLSSISRQFEIDEEELRRINNLEGVGGLINANGLFLVPNHKKLVQAFTQDGLLADLGEERVRLWLQRGALAHPPLRELEDTMILTEVWNEESESAFALRVAQLPYNSEYQWLALDDDERTTNDPIHKNIESHRGVLSIVAAIGNLQETTTFQEVTGIFLDQWDEPIPNNTIDTSATFQFNGPNSQAPQALLLAVPSQRTDTPTEWNVDMLADIVCDTMDLAKIRAVDLDAMREIENDVSGEQGVGVMLPALMLPADPSRPGWAGDEFVDSFTDWVEQLEEIETTSIAGVLNHLTLTSFEGEAWPLLEDPEFPLTTHLRGINSPFLQTAEVEVWGTIRTITKKLYAKDYKVTQYPSGFVEKKNIRGTVHSTPQLKLQVGRGASYLLQGGLAIEVGRLPSKTVEIIGHLHQHNSTNYLWIDDYEILDVGGGKPPIVIGIPNMDMHGSRLRDEDGKLWYLNSEDLSLINDLIDHYKCKIWVKGTKTPMEPSGSPGVGTSTSRGSTPSIDMTDFGLLRKESELNELRAS